MGVNERKERHKEDLKREILEAAKQLFTEKGFEATSIRAIAEKIEYSPATI
jgi:AcrR family transcriptional regulator